MPPWPNERPEGHERKGSRMTKTTRADMMLADVMGMETPINIAHEAAQAMGLTLEQLFTTRVGKLKASQMRALCKTLRRSSDELLGLTHEDAATV